MKYASVIERNIPTILAHGFGLSSNYGGDKYLIYGGGSKQILYLM